MKIICKVVIALVFLLVLTSCEAQREINVLVLNEKTGNPIDRVFVKIMAGKGEDFTKAGTEGYTNERGNYETNIMIGCAGGCYDIKIFYSKEGFKALETMNQTQDTVYLTPVK